MVEHREQMGFTFTAFADENNRPTVARPNGFDGSECISRWIGNVEEVGGPNLRGTRVA